MDHDRSLGGPAAPEPEEAGPTDYVGRAAVLRENADRLAREAEDRRIAVQAQARRLPTWITGTASVPSPGMPLSRLHTR